MQEICNYAIEVQDNVDDETFNATSPFQVTVIKTRAEITLFKVVTDQSGLIGLVRHLHGQGFVIRSINRYRI